MKIIYVAGPFRAETAWGIELNVRAAEAAALGIWRINAVAVCPHTNSRLFHGSAPDEVFLDGYLDLVKRCDAIYVVRESPSHGVAAEVALARAIGIPVFDNFDELREWVRASGVLNG